MNPKNDTMPTVDAQMNEEPSDAPRNPPRLSHKERMAIESLLANCTPKVQDVFTEIITSSHSQPNSADELLVRYAAIKLLLVNPHGMNRLADLHAYMTYAAEDISPHPPTRARRRRQWELIGNKDDALATHGIFPQGGLSMIPFVRLTEEIGPILPEEGIYRRWIKGT